MYKQDSIQKSNKDRENNVILMPGKDTLIYVNNRKVLIKVSGNNKREGTFLLLSGWNFPPDDWYTKTKLCEKASKEGFFLVLPEMGKSIYQEKNFPETRADWNQYPTRKWVIDSLIPFLQNKFGLFKEKERNFIVGLSTGARGVALIALDLPKLFKGVAALSGDYNQLLLQHDNLITGYYGPYHKFKDRWKKIDNPLSRIKEFNLPIYLGHGTSDKVVPPEQTKIFYDALTKSHPQLKVKLHMPDAGHDYNYWSSEVDNILGFFKELK